MSRPAKRVARSSKVAARRKVAPARPVAKARAKAAASAKVAPRAGPAAREQVAAVAEGVAPVVAAPAADAFFLTLDASCTLRETADLQFSLVIANGDPLVIDAGAVERIDTAGLQLLVALVRRQQQTGRRLEWKAVSAELRLCGERLGLLGALDLPPADSGAAP
jgi:anti-anti-sigma regulatory factor